MEMPGQTRPGQTRPSQTRPGQTRPDPGWASTHVETVSRNDDGVDTHRRMTSRKTKVSATTSKVPDTPGVLPSHALAGTSKSRLRQVKHAEKP